ncbi:HNH endonuclease [Bacillus amyloliquefaciens]|uniref:HNH endonuclease n=1 Tax=Bacillus amyloliquefaciens TaxID=1390 RepID=UPI001C0464CD|nr:HNH endonuclease [Bacillus amyloliquefaciens]MBU0444437.1 HNH endonuclease [Bacillus amyloliquefaciens]
MKKLTRIISLVLPLLLFTSFVLPNFAEAHTTNSKENHSPDMVHTSTDDVSDDEAGYEESNYEDYSDVIEDPYYSDLANAPVYEGDVEDDLSDDSISEEAQDVSDKVFDENIVNGTEEKTAPEVDATGTDEELHAQFGWLLPPAIAIVSRVGGKLLVKQTLKSTTKKITVRNGKLAGKKHPKTGVKFNSKGFPVFAAKYNYNLTLGQIKSSNAVQFKNANYALKQAINNWEHAKKFNKYQIQDIKNGKTPRGYLWHHHENRGRLQLVDKNIHKKTGHTGGRSIWGSL